MFHSVATRCRWCASWIHVNGKTNLGIHVYLPWYHPWNQQVRLGAGTEASCHSTLQTAPQSTYLEQYCPFPPGGTAQTYRHPLSQNIMAALPWDHGVIPGIGRNPVTNQSGSWPPRSLAYSGTNRRAPCRYTCHHAGRGSTHTHWCLQVYRKGPGIDSNRYNRLCINTHAHRHTSKYTQTHTPIYIHTYTHSYIHYVYVCTYVEDSVRTSVGSYKNDLLVSQWTPV